MEIESYTFGEFIIDGRSYKHDIKIINNKIDKWHNHSLSMDDMEEIFEANPDYIIIGTGASGVVKVIDKIQKEAESRKIELIILLTDEACDKFNELNKKGENVAAIMHSTC
ncbi:Mth938-like domain-containing protein [Nanoarchaeota archaeon]